MIQRPFVMVGVMLTIILCTSCVSPVHLSIYQTETEWVDLREWPIGYPMLSNLSHPVEIESTKLREVLQNIRYRQSELFSFHMGKQHPAFSEYQLALLAAELRKAFGQALPEEVIAFRVRNEQTGHLYTKGFSFILEDELHLVIQELQQPDFDSPANQTRPPTVRWEFAPQVGQHIFAPLSHSTHDFPHWIITPIFKRSSNGML